MCDKPHQNPGNRYILTPSFVEFQPRLQFLFCQALINTHVSCILIGSRDQTVKIWNIESCEKPIHTISCNSCVTSVAFTPTTEIVPPVLAIGTQDGNIRLLNFAVTEEVLSEKSWTANLNQAHGGAVRRMKWQHPAQTGELQLASCSDDHSIRLFSFKRIARK